MQYQQRESRKLPRWRRQWSIAKSLSAGCEFHVPNLIQCKLLGLEITLSNRLWWYVDLRVCTDQRQELKRETGPAEFFHLPRAVLDRAEEGLSRLAAVFIRTLDLGMREVSWTQRFFMWILLFFSTVFLSSLSAPPPPFISLFLYEAVQKEEEEREAQPASSEGFLRMVWSVGR